MLNRFLKLNLLLIISSLALSCEIDTKLKVTGGNPPVFEMTGNGDLTSIRVVGHKTQREAAGEAASVYWEIDSKDDEEILKNHRQGNSFAYVDCSAPASAHLGFQRVSTPTLKGSDTNIAQRTGTKLRQDYMGVEYVLQSRTK